MVGLHGHKSPEDGGRMMRYIMRTHCRFERHRVPAHVLKVPYLGDLPKTLHYFLQNLRTANLQISYKPATTKLVAMTISISAISFILSFTVLHDLVISFHLYRQRPANTAHRTRAIPCNAVLLIEYASLYFSWKNRKFFRGEIEVGMPKSAPADSTGALEGVA